MIARASLGFRGHGRVGIPRAGSERIYRLASTIPLPTDGTADSSDCDSDLRNNWQEWIAGTVPTDASSALRMLNSTNDAAGLTVSWQSVSNRMYFVERATDLGTPQPFLVLEVIVGQAGTTSFTDTTAVGPGPFFYRVGVQ